MDSLAGMISTSSCLSNGGRCRVHGLRRPLIGMSGLLWRVWENITRQSSLFCTAQLATAEASPSAPNGGSRAAIIKPTITVREAIAARPAGHAALLPAPPAFWQRTLWSPPHAAGPLGEARHADVPGLAARLAEGPSEA
jgi:hypothetical protein